MVPSGRYRLECAGRRSGLALVVQTPALRRSIHFQRAAVVNAGADGRECSAGGLCFTMSMTAPTYDATVGPQAATVPTSGFNVVEAACGSHRFSELVLAPTDCRSVQSDPATMLAASVDRLELTSWRRLSGSPDTAPAQRGTGGQQTTGMLQTGGYGDKLQVAGRHITR